MFCRQLRTTLSAFVYWSVAAQAALLLNVPANGQEHPAPLVGADLEAYLKRASEANPDLTAYRQRYEAALGRVAQSRSLPDPMLQITQFVESVQTRTGPQEQVIMLNQRVPWFGKLDKREAAASAEAEALWYAFQSRQLMLARTVADAFYDYAYTGKAVTLLEENLRLLQELEPSVEERVRGGGEINPLLRLKVEVGRTRDRLRSLQETRRAQSAKLAALLDLPADTTLAWPEWEVAKNGGTRNIASLTEALLSTNPELAMMQRQVASAAARRELARLEGYPDVTVGVNYITISEPLNSTMADAGTDPWGVTLGINVPIWRGRLKSQRQEALAMERAAEAVLADRENQLKSELSITLSKLRDAERRLDLYGNELLGLARQAVENSRNSYTSGRVGILEVIDSERSLIELDLQYWRAAADTWQARATLQTLVNQPITADSPAAP